LGVGGLPRGRVVEIYGPESSGKTTLTLQVIAEMQKQAGTCAFVDAEHALDIQYAQKLGVNLQELLISQPDTGEQALEIVDSLVRSGAVDLIVVDSVAALTPKAELEGEMGDSLPGLQARLMSQALRKLTGAHQKDQLHGHLHQPDPHEDRCDVWARLRRPRAVTHSSSTLLCAWTSGARAPSRRARRPFGNETKVKVVKNKVSPPFKTAEFDILFGEGISRDGEIIDMGVNANILEKSGAWYAYNGEKIGQGRDNARREFLRENPEYVWHLPRPYEIENKVGEEPGQLDKILDELQAKDFINDQRAADSLIHRRAGRLGTSRVLHELRGKGVDAATVSQAASQLKATELARATEVWRKKFGESATDASQRVKQMRFLAGRGFAPEVIRRVVSGSDDCDESYGDQCL
jgi:recombination protein RecA